MSVKTQFGKGNTAGAKTNKLPVDCKMAKDATKQEIIRTTRDMVTLPKEEFMESLVRPEATTFEGLVSTAIKRSNFKFAQWLIEMSIGKPTQLSDPEEKISNIEQLVKNLAKKKDPFAPKAKE